jgi:hypothetical protein
MSRQPIRLRPPADDDLAPLTEEEMRKRTQVAAETKNESSALAHTGRATREEAMPHGAGPETAARNAYFTGRYAQADVPGGTAERMEPEKYLDRWLLGFDLPDSLRHCVLELVHVLREDGLSAALAALHNDPALDRRFEMRIRQLLAVVEMEYRRARS